MDGVFHTFFFRLQKCSGKVAFLEALVVAVSFHHHLRPATEEHSVPWPLLHSLARPCPLGPCSSGQSDNMSRVCTTRTTFLCFVAAPHIEPFIEVNACRTDTLPLD